VRLELEAHSKHLGEMLKHSIPRIPTREEVAALRAGVADVIAYGKPALKKELFDDLLVDVQIHPGQNAYPRFKVPDVDHPGPFVAKTLNRTKVSSEHQIVELMPPYPNFGSTLPGHWRRLGVRKRRTANCRDEVLVALQSLIEQYGDRAFPVSEVYAEMVSAGTTYAQLTAYKAMQRMKVADPRLPGVRLERVGREGFRLAG